MKKLTLTLLFFALAAGISFAAEQTLNDWKMKGEGLRKPIRTEVPATVAGVLADNGILPEDLFVSDNYRQQDKSIFDGEWTFTTKFKTRGRKGSHFLLQFNSLGFYADIELNGKKLASSDTTSGVFIRREYDITSIARSLRKNKLIVTLRRAQEGDLNIGFVDWNPRPLDESMGILGDVVVKTVGQVSLNDVYVKPVLDVETLESADLHIAVALDNKSDKTVSGVLSLSYENGSAEIPVELIPGENKVKLSPENMDILHVDSPRVWWTWDLGTPELYDLNVAFKENDVVSDSRDVTFGIRSIESKVIDNHRQFYLNGRPVLVKGAGWSDEIFLRDTHESNELQALYVKDMGMNCIRFENIWGKDDNIYDCCDRLGLMAMVGWSCQWEWESYCGLPETDSYGCISSPEDIKLAAAYFHDQVIRLHNHPSIICWLTGSDRIPGPELEKLYMEIYDEYEYRPYVCSAKDMASEYGGPSGTKMEGPYEYVGPDYWYLDKDLGGAFGFNTETGIGMNLPQIPSLRKMMSEDEIWPLSKAWDAHCTASSSAMNSIEVMTEVMDNAYGHAETLEEYVNRAHAIDYDATRAMFESFRCNIPVSTGIIQWMLNSAWPSLYWQLYDYYMVPTAAYYGTRKACQPVQLVYNYGLKEIFLVNETGADKSVVADIHIYDANSSLIEDYSLPAVATDNKPASVLMVPDHDGGIFIAAEVKDESGNVIADNFYCIPEKNNVYNWDRSNWYMTPISEYADMSFVSNLAEATVSMKVEKSGNTYSVELTNESEVISYQNILQLTDAAGEMIAPAFWSDNFTTILPGQTKTLTCTVPDGAEGNVNVQTWNTNIK